MHCNKMYFQVRTIAKICKSICIFAQCHLCTSIREPSNIHTSKLHSGATLCVCYLCCVIDGNIHKNCYLGRCFSIVAQTCHPYKLILGIYYDNSLPFRCVCYLHVMDVLWLCTVCTIAAWEGVIYGCMSALTWMGVVMGVLWLGTVCIIVAWEEVLSLHKCTLNNA